MCVSFLFNHDDQISEMVEWWNSDTEFSEATFLHPGQHIPVIVKNDNGIGIVGLRWGFELSHEDNQYRVTGRYCNARWENVATSPIWVSSFHQRRAVVPIDVFTQGEHNFRAETGSKLFAAALYNLDKVPRVTIITRPSYDPVLKFHRRSPVFITQDGMSTWLDESLPQKLLNTFINFAANYYNPSLLVVD